MPPPTSSIAFFSSAASSFQPAPYAAITQSSSSRTTSHLTRTLQRSHESLANPPPGMDPLPTDPNVHFIHPPFNIFPNSHLHPDGLTYQLMADNPEWFLDAKDFLSPESNSGLAVYPPHLEPPRGWCPAKKKDLKERGVESWPEGEEPRLRCTFCRRTYAGVNAKSMWRRHVFEKHMIAMSNRRDGKPDRPRGRGSGKENRPQSVTNKVKDATHDSLLSIVVAPQTVPDNISHKSRFRPAKLHDAPKHRRDHERPKDASKETLAPTEEACSTEEHSDEESDSGDDLPHNSPLLTPHNDTSSDPTYALVGELAMISDVSTSTIDSLIPESPYNPLQTPSFRHSPPRLPSDQPWRFPSPSHPLHSTTRDLSLTIVAQPNPSPTIKDFRAIGSSPSGLLTISSSPFLKDTPLRSSGEFQTPARNNLLFSKSTNRPYLLMGQQSSPLGPVKEYRSRSHTFGGGSPLRKSFTTLTHKRHSSATSEAWFSEGNLASLSSTPHRLSHISTDPFSIYDSWPTIVDERISPVRFPRPEPDSPVLRSRSRHLTTGLGIGLLEPFSSPKKSEDSSSLFSPQETSRTSQKRLIASDDSTAEGSPPSKKRRTFPEP